MELPPSAVAAAARLGAALPELAPLLAREVREDVAALAVLPARAVDSFLLLLLGTAAEGMGRAAAPTPEQLHRLDPYIEQRAELGVPVDQVLGGLHRGARLVVARLLADCRPPLSGAEVAQLMFFGQEWVEQVRRHILTVHRTAELRLARTGRDRDNALLRELLVTGAASAVAALRERYLPPGRLHLARFRPHPHEAAWAAESALTATLGGPVLSGVLDGSVLLVTARPVLTAPAGRRIVTAGPAPAADLVRLNQLLAVALGLADEPGLVPLPRVAQEVVRADQPELGRLLGRTLLAGLHPERPDHAEILRTLASYLDLGARLDLAARQRHVHVNTIKHRLERCRELTGTDPGDPAIRGALLWAAHRLLADRADAGAPGPGSEPDPQRAPEPARERSSHRPAPADQGGGPVTDR
ncbi:hypothetical protein GCM10009665_18740 [Kitasatospora nipponensis]|uniref:PucR-like helix-turn-helix protein n=1 Tax=Kitasatospora nipponensis TaxID=258049 RepID=A0ABN1VZN9_9ACTN